MGFQGEYLAFYYSHSTLETWESFLLYVLQKNMYDVWSPSAPFFLKGDMCLDIVNFISLVKLYVSSLFQVFLGTFIKVRFEKVVIRQPVWQITPSTVKEVWQVMSLWTGRQRPGFFSHSLLLIRYMTPDKSLNLLKCQFSYL